MTSVANQPVPGDVLGTTAAPGKKSKIGDRAGFLGTGPSPNKTVGGVYAGTLGGSTGPGTGLPGESAGTLTKIEAAHKIGGSK